LLRFPLPLHPIPFSYSIFHFPFPIRCLLAWWRFLFHCRPFHSLATSRLPVVLIVLDVLPVPPVLVPVHQVVLAGPVLVFSPCLSYTRICRSCPLSARVIAGPAPAAAVGMPAFCLQFNRKRTFCLCRLCERVCVSVVAPKFKCSAGLLTSPKKLSWSHVRLSNFSLICGAYFTVHLPRTDLIKTAKRTAFNPNPLHIAHITHTQRWPVLNFSPFLYLGRLGSRGFGHGTCCQRCQCGAAGSGQQCAHHLGAGDYIHRSAGRHPDAATGAPLAQTWRCRGGGGLPDHAHHSQRQFLQGVLSWRPGMLEIWSRPLQSKVLIHAVLILTCT